MIAGVGSLGRGAASRAHRRACEARALAHPAPLPGMTRTEHRLQLLAARKRAADHHRWFRKATAAAMFPGVLIPFRPNRSAWWWTIEHDVRLDAPTRPHALPLFRGMLASLCLHGGYWRANDYTIRGKPAARWITTN